MLVHLYFPELRDHFDALFESRGQVNSVIADHKREYEKGQLDGERFLKPLTHAKIECEQRGEAFKSEIAKLTLRS